MTDQMEPCRTCDGMGDYDEGLASRPCERCNGTGEQELSDPAFLDALERSSLGTPGAKAIRARTPKHVTDEIMRRLDERRSHTHWVEDDTAACRHCGMSEAEIVDGDTR